MLAPLFSAPCGAHRSVAGPQAGHTLQEALVALALAGAVATAAGNLHGTIQRERLTSEVNTLIRMLYLARSEAIRRGNEVVLCPTSDGANCASAGGDHVAWQVGMLVFSDADGNGTRGQNEPIVRVHQPSAAVAIKSSTARPKVIFHPSGLSAGTAMTITVCAPTTRRARYVILSTTGRARTDDKPGDGIVDQPYERCA